VSSWRRSTPDKWTASTITGSDITGINKSNENFRTYAPIQYEGLANKLIERGVVVTARQQTDSPWAALLYTWAPILLMIGFWLFFMRQMQSGGNKALSFGKSKAKLSSSTQKKVTFKDVAGVDEAKDELQEIIDFLREPQKFQKLGRPHPQGRAADGSPRNRQDPAGARRGRRGQRAVLLHQRLRLRRDVRRRGRLPRARPVRAGQEERAPASCSSTRSTPSAGTVARAWAAVTTSASRR
jgi:ATP-dependent Zn protease